jgi:hypothetical protein
MSTNDGTDWIAKNSDLSGNSLLIKSIVFCGNSIVISTSGGNVFSSPDDGNSWTSIKSGLPENEILSLAISGSNIFAGTDGSGIWSRLLSDIGGLTSINNDEMGDITVYPNPVINTMFIKGLPYNSIISIYDFQGQKVLCQPFTENQLDISHLTNGIYTIKLENRTGVSFKKIIKL